MIDRSSHSGIVPRTLSGVGFAPPLDLMYSGSETGMGPGSKCVMRVTICCGVTLMTVMAQDFTVINVTPAQIVTRMAAFEPGPFLVSDPAYVQKMGGMNQDASVMHGVSSWLDDSIIPVPEIEAFKKELAAKGMR